MPPLFPLPAALDRRPLSHVVAEVRFAHPDRVPSVRCSCGVLVMGQLEKSLLFADRSVAAAFAQHRGAVGCASVGMADSIGSRRREIAFA